MKIVAHNLEKNFFHRKVIRSVNFELSGADSLVITGANGSGKTTLVKMICGLLSPSGGSVNFFDVQKIPREEVSSQIGLVGPYLQLYKDLSAWENLTFFAKARHGWVDKKRIVELLVRVGLKGREFDTLKTYSSGMLQRVKYIMALYHKPAILVLDEPSASLDKRGKQLVYDIINDQKKHNIVIIATNEAEEIQFADNLVDVAS